MKKFVLLLLILFSALNANAKNVDYEQVYRDLESPKLKYIHDIDPGEYYDTKDSTWSPYPLFRLISPIYFKDIKAYKL